MGRLREMLKSKEMLKLSYMMSAPVVFVSTVYLLIQNNNLINGWIALVFSFIFGLISLKILMKLVARVNFSKVCFWFGILCFAGFFISFAII